MRAAAFSGDSTKPRFLHATTLHRFINPQSFLSLPLQLETHRNKSKRVRNLFLTLKMPGITMGDTVPNLEVETTQGKIKLHGFFENSWTILFSHPGDFTPVCTTELGMMAAYESEFASRGVKLLGLSCDDIKSHNEWIKDIEAYTPGCKVKYPIISDPNREIIKQLNMVDPDEKDSSGNPVPPRALHIVGLDKKIKLSFLYPASAGRNMDEVLRALQSLQKASMFKIATPANWKPGDPVVISPSVTDEQAKEMFPTGYQTVDLPSSKKYLRFTNVSV